MILQKMREKIIFWSIKSLVPYGFPKGSIHEQADQRKYANYYHYLYNNEEFEHDKEFEQAIYNKHQTAKKMFFDNKTLLLFMIFVNLSNILFLRVFIIVSLIFISSFFDLLTTSLFNIKLLTMGGGVIFLLAFFFLFVSHILRYLICRKYINILCIFEVNCICQELEIECILSDSLQRLSLTKRLENLAKLVYICGKFDKSEYEYYSRTAHKILDNVVYLNRATDNTISDLKQYFWDLKYCFILDKKNEKSYTI